MAGTLLLTGDVKEAPMLLVRHVMATEPKTARWDMNAFDAASIMAGNDIGSVPVVDDEGNLIGLITDRDLATRVLAKRDDPRSVRLGDIATRKGLVTITPDAQASDARLLMAEHRIRRLPVIKGERLVGMVSLGDLAATAASERAVGHTLAEISASPATNEIQDGPDVGTPGRVRASSAKEDERR
jgi:CBS domain-containing protein